MNFDKELEYCRQNFGMAGSRNYSFLDRLFYMNVKKPSWCDRSDDLWGLFANKWNVFSKGFVVWGHIVQANTLLFEEGVHDCPASVVFSIYPKSRIKPNELAYAASCMYQLKNTTPDDEELRAIADKLTDEVTRTFGMNVPKRFSGEHDLFEATTFVSRKHLPNGILSQSLFPLVVTLTKPFYCLPLPSKFWSCELIKSWNQGY